MIKNNDIVIKSLTKSFGDKAVLSDFSAVIPGGKATCLMGPSGAGKTTLVNIILGLVKPDGGSISGVPEKISAVFQEDRLCEGFTASANIRLVTGKKVPEAEIAACLGELGLGESLPLPVSDFSGGMRRRVALARALLYGGELYVLDEPFKGLDDTTKKSVTETLLKYTKGKTVLCVTHDAEDAFLLGADIIEIPSL